MRKMIATPDNPLSHRTQADRQELIDRIAGGVPRDGRVELQPGVFVHRVSSPARPVHTVLEPSFCVIAQGTKQILVGDERFRYDPAHYFITTVGLPAVGQVVEASPDRPYFSFRLALDPAIVTAAMVELGAAQPPANKSVKSLDVSPLDANLLDAVLRLVRLAETPAEYRVLGPLVIREILYRLLTGAQSGRLRHLATFGGHDHRMVRAVKLLKDQFDKPLRIESLADELGMSVSGFHAHFKAVAAMSPLQFQKQLRLQEARRLMLTENFDAAEAGYRVGYDDASHFNREYKRHFGEPPMRDIDRLREMAVA